MRTAVRGTKSFHAAASTTRRKAVNRKGLKRVTLCAQHDRKHEHQNSAHMDEQTYRWGKNPRWRRDAGCTPTATR